MQEIVPQKLQTNVLRSLEKNVSGVKISTKPQIVNNLLKPRPKARTFPKMKRHGMLWTRWPCRFQPRKNWIKETRPVLLVKNDAISRELAWCGNTGRHRTPPAV